MTTASRIEPKRTTLLESERLSDRLGASVLLATETFQHTGSFKFRAAYELASHVDAAHVIAASSGNFGQALALACRLFGKRCTVVMPSTSASVKVDAVRGYGAQVELVDVSQESRAERVGRLSREFPDAYIASAYDDAWVIAGNASLGRELAEVPGLDAIVCPVGGGGLASGLIKGLSESGSNVPVVGAEPALANDAARSLREHRLIRDEAESKTIADGARTLGLGDRNWEWIRDGLQAIVEVPEEPIAEGARALFLLANLKAEPTGSLAVGALLADPARFRDRRVCCVISGGNVEPGVYSRMITGA